jgi:hypothetical protein
VNQLEYDLTAEDYIAFNIHVMRTSPIAQRQRLRFRITYTVLLGAFALLVLGSTHVDIMSVIVTIMTVSLLWFLAPHLWFMDVTQNIRRAAKQGVFGDAGLHRLSADASGLHDVTDHSTSTFAWSSVIQVDQTEEHAFIFISKIQAFVVPRRIGSDVFDSFLDEVDRLRAQG